MESRDLVSSARPKEAELGGGRAEPEEKEPERAGLGPALRGDEVIGDMMGERWGSHGEGEGLEEQEFSIKEASFQEGSLKLKIQTTKRTKKPPKSLENYICPPEIRMTIRPPSGEGRGGRLGGRAAQDKGPPRKRTYERPFRAAEPKEGGLLQLLGDVTPPKHQSKPSILHTTPLPPHTLTHQPQQQHTQPPQLTHQHTHSPAWATPPSASPANPVHTEPSREPAGANRSPLSDLASSFLKPPMKRVPESPSPRSFSPSPQRPLSPDLVLPVVTDASILNLTSLSRGRGLQEASEQLFGNIKRKYGRKDPQRTLGNTHNAELPWGRMAEKDAESLIVLDERQKYRRELEREERESIGRTRKEEERESIGRTRKEEERESIGRTRKEEERESIGRTRKEEERESIGRTRKEEERESIGRTRKEEERESIGRTRKEEERESIGRTRKEEERESIGGTRKEEERESIGRTRKEEERESIGRTRKEEERESIGRTRKEEERESIGRTRKEEERESIGRTRKEEERESIGRTRKEEERESIGRTRKEEERESIGKTRKEEERESIGRTRKEEERESIGRTRKEEERESIGRTRKEEERESIGRTRKEEERESIGRTRKEEEREMPMLGAPELMEEGIGRKRRRRQCLQESLTQKDQSEQLQGTDITERSKSGPPEPKVAHKMEGNKIDSPRSESRSGRSEEGSQLEADGDRGERGEKEEMADKGERTEIGEREEKGARVMSGANMESAMIQSWMRKNPVGHPRSATDPHKHPDLNPSPRLPSPNPNHIPSSRSTLNPNPRSPNLSRIFNPNPNTSLKASPNPSLPKTKDRWSYLKSRSLPNLVQRESGRSPLSTMCEPPSAFPITPSSPLYTNTDSLTVHTPAKRKRGRPKKQPLLTVETIHEGTSTSPLSPLARDSPAGLSRRRKTTLSQIASGSTSPNINELKLKRGEGAPVRPVKRLKLGKVQSILNEILSCSSQHGSLALKSASAPVSSAMTVMASTIEARLGKQINVSKRGTIYIGKKRGRKPRSDTLTLPPRGGGTKPPVPASMSSLYNRLLVPSSPPLSSSTLLLRPHTLSSLCHPSPHGLHSDATMPSLQPISALPSKPLGRGLLGAGWKLSPPRLLANSPSHLSEGAASIKEVTLSPISESHSEETIPSDSGIGTDNNSTSDQTEKGTNARRRYSFDLCGFEAAESAVLQASSRGSRGRCEQPAVADNFLSHQEKKQKHRRKRKCLQSRDHLNFLSELEEVVVKLQQLHVSHRRYASCYPQQPYPSIFRLNFHHHYYPLTYDPYPCDPAPYLRRTAELKTKRRRGRPAKTSEPITSKLPFVQGFGYPLAGGNYYAPYAMPYAPPLSLGYYTPSPPLYLPHHPHGPSPPSPFMRPAVPPPKFHSGGHSKLQASSGPLQGSSGRGEGLGSLGGGGLGGVRLHKRKHKHKHKHKEETNLLSPHDRQELGGLFSGAKTNGLLNLLTDRWEMTNQKRQEKQRGGGRGSRGGSRGAMFESNPLSSLSVDQVQFRQRTPGEPVCSFVSNYSSQSLRPDLTSDLFRLREEGSGHGRRRGLAVFGEEGVMSFHNARKEKIHEREESFHTSSPTLTGVPGKRRYKRHEVEQIHGEVRRMCSLNNQRSFEHVQKILRVKRLQRQAKTGNNVVKRRPGRPRKHPIDEFEANNYGSDIGRGFGMPVLERCVDLPGKRSLRPSPAPQPLEFSNHDSISVAIETVVHRARSLAPPLTRGGKRRGRPRKEEGGDMAFH